MIDPGRSHLFDAVYVRGPMALQALRNVIGDEAFFKSGQGLGSRSREPHPRGVDGRGPGAHHNRSWTVLSRLDLLPTAPARTAATASVNESSRR
jgi:hypothetical protein